MMVYLDEYAMGTRLHRWRFNLRTGKTSEECLDQRILEFGMINARTSRLPYRYAYSADAKPGWFLFTGLVKHDLDSGASTETRLRPGSLWLRGAVRAADRCDGRGRRLSGELHHR